MAQAALAIGAIMSVVGTVSQMSSAKKAEKLEKKKAQGAERVATVDAERARRSAIREKMIAQGQVTAQGAGQGFGLGGTSGVTGALASIGSQTNTNVGNVNRNLGTAVSMARVGTQISEAQNQGAQWGQITSLGMNVMQNSQQIGSIFKKA